MSIFVSIFRALPSLVLGALLSIMTSQLMPNGLRIIVILPAPLRLAGIPHNIVIEESTHASIEKEGR